MTIDLQSYDHEVLLAELRAREAPDGSRIANDAPCGTCSGGTVATRPPVELEAGYRNPALAEVSSDDLADAIRSSQRVIYGVDDRLDMFHVTDIALRRDADSVVALVRVGSITDNGDGTSTLTGQTLGAARNLCATEPFRNQPAVAFCSGFLVDPTIVVTAAHCVDTSNLDGARFVFGFEMTDANTAVTRIPNTEIYSGRRILGRSIGVEGTDWCVVQLDRPVVNHRYVSIRRAGKLADGAAVHVIGHPSGIPKKVAGGATVRDNTPGRFFVANLDTYGGNSGSPVFATSTHQLEGILVRGETDYVTVNGCNRSNVCPANGCRGEDVTRATEFAELVPLNNHDFIPFDHTKAKAVKAGGRWKVEVSGMWLLDFGTSRSEALQALKIIKHYKLNTQCFVGRPNPSMEFYLTGGSAPTGSLAGEDCIPFNPDTVEVRQIGGRWKVVDGNHWILDFAANQAEARQALSYILRYQFRQICFVGRPGPSMTYFKA